jgi:hypothetical protein
MVGEYLGPDHVIGISVVVECSDAAARFEVRMVGLGVSASKIEVMVVSQRQFGAGAQFNAIPSYDFFQKSGPNLQDDAMPGGMRRHRGALPPPPP